MTSASDCVVELKHSVYFIHQWYTQVYLNYAGKYTNMSVLPLLALKYIYIGARTL